jgi:hypothetical protein
MLRYNHDAVTEGSESLYSQPETPKSIVPWTIVNKHLGSGEVNNNTITRLSRVIKTFQLHLKIYPAFQSLTDKCLSPSPSSNSIKMARKTSKTRASQRSNKSDHPTSVASRETEEPTTSHSPNPITAMVLYCQANVGVSTDISSAAAIVIDEIDDDGPTFHPFPKLPKELQQMVWELLFPRGWTSTGRRVLHLCVAISKEGRLDPEKPHLERL